MYRRLLDLLKQAEESFLLCISTEGKPFCCDKCQSPYVIDPKKVSSKQMTKKAAGPRYKVDPETGKRLKLCNACGKSRNIEVTFHFNIYTCFE